MVSDSVPKPDWKHMSLSTVGMKFLMETLYKLLFYGFSLATTLTSIYHTMDLFCYASFWFLNRKTILDVMVSISIYPILNESFFVVREENHEIYREIYGDPIYDVYEDDVHVIDFVFKDGSFERLICRILIILCRILIICCVQILCKNGFVKIQVTNRFM